MIYMKKNRIKLIGLMLTVICFLSLTAYGKTSEKVPVVLKIGTSNTVKSANIFYDYNLGILAQLSNPALMKMGAKGELTGLVAKRVEVSTDHTVWKFVLNPDFYWSDGKKLTPEDVKFSIEYTGNHNPNAGWIKETLKEARVIPGENAVAFTFTKPYTTLNLEFTTYTLLPKHVWANIDKPMEYANAGENVGCGPFYLKKVDLNAGIVYFQKNPYWKGKQPKIDALEVHIFQNMDVLALALEKGDVDVFYKYAASYPYQNIARLKRNRRFNLVEQANLGLLFLGFNLTQKPMSDPAFRNAVAAAVNYQEIIQLDALGYGKIPNRGFVPPNMGYFKATPRLNYQPALARKLLEKAGYVDKNKDGIREDLAGKNLKLTLLVRNDFTRVGELLKDYLKAVGIETVLKSVESNTWFSLKDQYQYDLTVTRTTPWGMLMHAGWGTGYLDSRRTGQGVLHNVSDPEFLELCDQILATTDSAKLKQFGADVQAYYAEQLPVIPLYWNTVVTPYNKQFKGWVPDPLYGIYNVDNFINLEKAK
jgi:peptide/nickel transport system substrate-binding protein